jgi:hypothetical protein
MTEDEVRAREAFFENATSLLDRELQRSRIAPRRHEDEGHGLAADSLEVSVGTTLKEFKTVCALPEKRHWDPIRVKFQLFKLAALVATERMLSDPLGISHEHLRDPERHYDLQTVLLLQECRKAEAARLRSSDPWYNPTSLRLRKTARRMLDDMHANPAACRMHPMRTKRRLLKVAALVATDRMLSLDSVFPFDIAERPEPHLRTSCHADRESPESFELRLLHFNAREN